MPPLNVLAAMLLWMGVAIALVIGVWLLARRAMPRDALTADDTPSCHETGYRASTRDLAAAVAFRIAALYSIILALVYAQLVQEFRDVRAGLTQESVAISETYQDARRYGPAAAPVAEAMKLYTDHVVNREWRRLGEERRLSTRAWAAHAAATEAALALPADTPRQASLRSAMLDGLQEIAAYRHARLDYAASAFSFLFWIPAVLGLVLVVIPFYVFPPTRPNRVMLACFGAFTGLILFFIHGFGSPFREPVLMSPRAFERLLVDDFNRQPVSAPDAAPAPRP